MNVWQFRDFAARGRSALEQGDAAAAVTLLSAAIGLWRGPALADIREAAFAPLAAERLEEERLIALENLVDTRLVLGQHRELVPEIEALTAASPYREHFHAQLMLALYQSAGRLTPWPPSPGPAPCWPANLAWSLARSCASCSAPSCCKRPNWNRPAAGRPGGLSAPLPRPGQLPGRPVLRLARQCRTRPTGGGAGAGGGWRQLWRLAWPPQ